MALAGLAAVSLSLAGSSIGNASSAKAAVTGGKTHDSRIPNLGLVKEQIQAYYGDDGKHEASPTSDYAKDVARVEEQVQRWLDDELKRPDKATRPALVLDVDDTLLSSYTYGVTHEFAGYSTTGAFAECVVEKCGTAVFGMPDLVNRAASRGVAIFLITGRPGALRDVTLANLLEQGYQAPTELFLKPTAAPFPAYLPCADTCSTVEFKSATRAYIEARGYHIVANVGDQLSDLDGGHADHSAKVPNPMYFLP